MELKAWLQEKLERKGWRPYRLAIAARVDPAFLSRLLSGKKDTPSLWTMLRIVRALGLSAGDLDNLTEPVKDRSRSSPPRVE